MTTFLIFIDIFLTLIYFIPPFIDVIRVIILKFLALFYFISIIRRIILTIMPLILTLVFGDVIIWLFLHFLNVIIIPILIIV